MHVYMKEADFSFYSINCFLYKLYASAVLPV